MLFDDAFDLYLFDQYLIEKKNLSEYSRKLYVEAVERFLAEYKPDNIDHYNDFLIKLTIKKRGYYYYSALKAFIEYKIEDAGTKAKMIDSLVKPNIQQTTKTERKYLEETEIIDIVNHMSKTKHKVIALIQVITGLRAGEVISIRRGDIVPEIYENNNVLKIIVTGKGNKRNVVHIHDNFIQALVLDYIVKNPIHPEYYFIETSTRVFKDYEHSRIVRTNYHKYYADLKRAMFKVGLNHKDFATHDYRRCFAQRVWTKYKDLKVLQDLLNHANPATTMRYLKHSGMSTIDYHKSMQS
jgi:integrase